jgi:hypothetical protein
VTETSRYVYGNAAGVWMLVESAVGTISPLSINVGVDRNVTTLMCLGADYDVVTMVYNEIYERRRLEGPRAKGARRPGNLRAQEILAQILGVKQQSVSTYIRGGRPQLSPDGWRNLVRAWHDPMYAVAEVLAAGVE